jgi:Gpi18-like mannosyltransferase
MTYKPSSDMAFMIWGAVAIATFMILFIAGILFFCIGYFKMSAVMFFLACIIRVVVFFLDFVIDRLEKKDTWNDQLKKKGIETLEKL